LWVPAAFLLAGDERAAVSVPVVVVQTVGAASWGKTSTSILRPGGLRVRAWGIW
jgi:hypothetical protein